MQKQGQVLQCVITNLKAKSILYTVDDFSNVINALFQFSFPIAYFQLFITVQGIGTRAYNSNVWPHDSEVLMHLPKLGHLKK